MRRIRQFRWLFALLCCLAALPATADTRGLNSELSSLYVEITQNQAVDAGQALELVTIALDFVPNSSDALFLRAWINRDRQEETLSVLSDLQRSLEYDNFDAVDPDMAAVLYAQTLVRTGHAREALFALEDVDIISPEIDPEIVADAYFVRARATGLLELGREKNSAIVQGRTHFPDDPRFFGLELSAEESPSFRYRRELERLLRAAVDGPEMLAAILRYGLTAPTASEQYWAHASYLALGGDDPWISVVPSGGDEISAGELFVRLGGYRDLDVFGAMLDLLQAAPAEESRSADEESRSAGTALQLLVDGARAYTGYSLTDRNGDGFWEERLSLENGLVVRWEMDQDQNGVNELDVAFVDGEPSAAIIEQAGDLVTATYENYPYVETLTLAGANLDITYSLLPHTILLPVVAVLPPGGPGLETPPGLASGFSGVDLGAARLAAATREERNARNQVVEVRNLEDGVIIRSRRDSNGDGEMDHLIVYEAGLPSAGLRDIDGDGYFEVAEAYAGGALSMVTVDEDDNGIPDMTEFVADSGRREWDLNQDGVVDVREFGIWADSVRFQFPFLGIRR